MQFITYFELNENMSESERQAIAAKVMESGLFPPAGVNILSWDATPDLWGTIRVEADTVEQVVQAIGMWRAVGGGFFKVTKTSPTMAIQDIIPLITWAARTRSSRSCVTSRKNWASARFSLRPKEARCLTRTPCVA